jgi:hypothetical protein
VDIYLVSPSGVELNLNSFGVNSSHFVNEYPKGAFDIAPVEHISRYTADGLPYLDTYRRRPIVVDLKLTAVGSTATNLWSEIATVLAQARMSKTSCKLKIVESGKTVYLDVYPESSAVIPSVLSGDITLRLVSYGRWYSGTLRTETLTTRASQTVANISARLQQNGWSNLGGGTSATVTSIAVAPNGMLYVGGNFTTAGGVTVNYIAKWNGSSWSALGSGMNGGVSALAVAPDGTLYAGGGFTTAGGVTVNYIAKWNGSSWSALGSGMNGSVSTLAIAPDGTLYAGGAFFTAGGVTVNRIAKWNGSSWSALGNGMNNYVDALAVAPDGTLYAGGAFLTAGGVTVNRIAKWNGLSWSALGSGMNTGSVNTLAIAPDGVLYAGGDFAIAGGVTVNSIAKWDGSSWSALGGGMNANASVYALAVAPDGMLYAGGNFTTAGGIPLSDWIALWNGYRWLPLDIDFPGIPYIDAITCPGVGVAYLGGISSGTATYSAVNTTTNVTSDVYPQLKFTASTAATVQYIENQTIGKRVWLNYNMLPGEVLTLDFSQATATSSTWGNVLRAVAPGSNMKFSLAKGTNSVWLFVPTGTVTAQLSWYPQYETLAEALQ